MMKRPSNVVLAFGMTIGSSLLIWVGYLFVLEATHFFKLQVEEIYESQVQK